MVLKDDLTYSFTDVASIRKKTVAATIAIEMIQKEMATGSLGSRNPCKPVIPTTRKTLGLTTIAKCQHGHRAKQQSPEHTPAEVWLDCRKDQIEFYHLQRNGD